MEWPLHFRCCPHYSVPKHQAAETETTTASASAANGEAAASDGEADAAPAIDVYDLADPVAILGKIPSSFTEDVEAAKWSIRNDAVEAVNKLANTPKLADGDYGDLVRVMKRVRRRLVPFCALSPPLSPT